MVVDDEWEVCESVRQIAQRFGYEVCVTSRSRDFQAAYDSFQPDIVMLDIVMPDMDGVEILKQLAARDSRSRVIMMTGYSDGYLAKAVELGRGLGLASISGVQKPLTVSQLKRVLKKPAGPDKESETQAYAS